MESASVSHTSHQQATTAPEGSRVERAAEQLAGQAQELLHDVGTVAVDAYHAGTNYLEQKAHLLAERTDQAVETVTGQARRTGRATRRFVSGNAGPWLMVGAGFGWLALRMLNQSRRPATRVGVRRDRASTPGPSPAHPTARLSAATTSGAKLMGVRTHDAGYIE